MLTRDELEPYLGELSPAWTVSDDGKKIHRTLAFKTFEQNIAFVNRVADLAQAQGHHPDMTILYNRLEISLSTHAIGGLSENDFILASKIDLLLAPSPL